MKISRFLPGAMELYSPYEMGTPMNVESLLTCARQIWFTTNQDEIPYAFGGSGFLCQLGSEIYAVTAKHVVKGQPHNTIFITRHSKSLKPLHIDEFIEIKPRDDPNEEWGDLAIYRLQSKMYSPAYFGHEAPYLLPGSVMGWTPNMDGHFLVRGYPRALSNIDYDTGKIYRSSFDLLAQLDDAPCADGRVQIRFLNSELDLDGISGAPVIWVSKDHPCDHCLAGVMLRATAESSLGWFLHVDVLAKTLVAVSDSVS